MVPKTDRRVSEGTMQFLSLDLSDQGSFALVHRRSGNGNRRHRDLRDPFLHPDLRARPSHLPSSNHPAAYLVSVKANILAEYAAMLNSVPPLRSFFVTEKERDDDSPVITRLLATCEQAAGNPEELKQFKRHLFSIRGTLCLAKYWPDGDYLTYTTGTPPLRRNTASVNPHILHCRVLVSCLLL